MTQRFIQLCNRYQWRALAAICLAAFILSLGYSFYFRIEPAVDAKAYDGLGWHLAQYGSYDSSQYALSRPGPGYGYFLGIIYSIFGHSYPAVWVVQSLLHALTALLVFLMARIIFKESQRPIVGLIAAALIGFSPDLITGAAMLMTETISLFLLALVACLFFKYTEFVSKISLASQTEIFLRRVLEKKTLFLFAAAFFLALAALTRSNLLLLALPMLIYFLANKEWRAAIVFSALLLIFLTPWTIRNYQLYGIIKPFNTGTGALLYSGNHPGATGEQVANFEWPEGYNELSQLEFDKLAKRDAVEFIKNNPFEFIKITLYRISIYFSFARPTGFWFHLHGLSKAVTLAASALYSAVLFIAGFFGAAFVLKRQSWSQLKSSKAFYLMLMAIMMPLAIIFITVETRYRYPIYPLLAVFAGYGISEMLSNFRANLKVFAIVAGTLSLNALFDITRNLQRIIERITTL